MKVDLGFSEWLSTGHWFLSVYNDDADDREVVFLATIAEGSCPQGCNRHGKCHEGQCVCDPGFSGPTCQERTCPVLCNGKGEYRDGECFCDPGWKGADCSVRHADCIEPDCSSHGVCVDGSCQCAQGYKGEFCQEVDCLDPSCAGHGYCLNGTCLCLPGWTGKSCEESEPCSSEKLCGDHGLWTGDKGTCECHEGWTGPSCDKAFCTEDCGSHGVCHEGTCLCEPGWGGPGCATPTCDDTCKGQCKKGKCLCPPGWNGALCTVNGCPNSCGSGSCVQGRSGAWECRCPVGWAGNDCQTKLETSCSDRRDNDGGLPYPKAKLLVCARTGAKRQNSGGVGNRASNMKNDPLKPQPTAERSEIPQRYGTLSGEKGLAERYHFSIEEPPTREIVSSKPADPHRRLDGLVPEVLVFELEPSVFVPDGLIDCQDPECCPDPACKPSQLCLTSPEPTDVLLRKPAPHMTATFFEKMRFIIEDQSIQSYASNKAFNDSMASVIRGRVVTADGQGIPGVRISTIDSAQGFTLSRKGGMFDMMVNGGGAVELHFNRQPFRAAMRRVIVPWNQVSQQLRAAMRRVIVPWNQVSQPFRAAMRRVIVPWNQVSQQLRAAMRRVIVPWNQVSQPFRAAMRLVIVPWNQIIVMDEVPLLTNNQAIKSSAALDPNKESQLSHCPDHDFNLLQPLVWSSMRTQALAGGCPEKSTVFLESQVVQESIKIPGTDLHLVYRSSQSRGYLSLLELRLTPPSPTPKSLKNIRLHIAVEGNEFTKTLEPRPNLRFTYAWDKYNVYRQAVWGSALARVRVGYDYGSCLVWEVRTAELPGLEPAVSEVGGWNIAVHRRYNPQGYVSSSWGLVHALIGERGKQRTSSAGRPTSAREKPPVLMAPRALATDSKGNVYVGDYDLIKKIYIDGRTRTVLRLNTTRVSYRYHLAVDPFSGALFISDPESYLVLRVGDPERDQIRPEPWIGNGNRCLPGNECGDGKRAMNAQLIYPKGIAVTTSGVTYIADGTTIRMVDEMGIITTVLGSHYHKNHWSPMPCDGVMEPGRVRLRWPTELAINPLDGTLHILDNHLVLQLLKDGRVKIVAGRPINCPLPEPRGAASVPLATDSYLVNPQSIAFNFAGELFVVESDSQRINRLRVRKSDGSFHHVAGKSSPCNCLECKCYTEGILKPDIFVFSSLSAVAVGPDRRIHLSDPGNLMVFSLTPFAPAGDSIHSGHLKYHFNRFGLHTSTEDLRTGKTLYQFSYTVDASNGKLRMVTDSRQRKILLLRDPRGEVVAIENPRNQKMDILLDRMNNLAEFRTPDSGNITFTYTTKGLLTRRTGEGTSRSYSYDNQGRCVELISPSGERMTLTFDLEEEAAKVTQRREFGDRPAIKKTVRIQRDGGVVVRQGDIVTKYYEQVDGSFEVFTPWESRHTISTLPFTIFEDTQKAEQFPMPSLQLVHPKDSSQEQSWSWRYFPVGEEIVREIIVNGQNLMTFKRNTKENQEMIFHHDFTIVNVTYDSQNRPVRWQPSPPFDPIAITYDRFGRRQSWRWGQQAMEFIYDRPGRLIEINENGRLTRFTYANFMFQPTSKTLPSGARYTMTYSSENGGLASIMTPGRAEYGFSLQSQFGYHRLLVRHPYSLEPFTAYFNEDGSLAQVRLCTDHGRMYNFFNQVGQIKKSIYGEAEISMGYENGIIKTVKQTERNFEMEIRFKYADGLVRREEHEFGPRSQLLNRTIEYGYDAQLQMNQARLMIDQVSQPVWKVERHPSTQFMVEVSGFEVSYPQPNRITLKDGKITVVYEMDGRGLLASKQLLFNHRRLAFKLKATRHINGQLDIRKISIANTDRQDSFTYNTDGYLSGASMREMRAASYVYDGDGNREGVSGQIQRDPCGRVLKIRGILLEFNAKGQIISVTKDAQRSTFSYDFQGRLTLWQGPERKDRISLAYIEDQITWVVNREGVKLILRDPWGHILGWEEEGKPRTYMATDQVGSPLAYFDKQGRVRKQVFRDPWGKWIQGDLGDFPIDFRGGFRDTLSEFILFGDRMYDPHTGIWLNPPWTDLTKKGFNGARFPEDVNLHLFMKNDPNRESPVPESLGIHESFHDWFKLNHYEAKEITRRFQPTIPPVLDQTLKLNFKPSTSASACAFETFLTTFHSPFTVASEDEGQSYPLARQASLFSPTLLLSTGSQGQVELTPGARGHLHSSVQGDVLSRVFNNTILLPSPEGIPTFLQSNPGRIDEDQRELARIAFLKVDRLDKTLVLQTMGEEIHLTYDKTVDPMRSAQYKAVERAWAREKWLAENGLPSLVKWSSQELRQLIETGRVHGYKPGDIHSVNKYSPLADDPANVLFIKEKV
ncbi:unnamed protein product [Cyprideis torosa]|uniref:Uncharacterized protein n=1 Tax=Cyprideis torosa TaxID=163714 RepID=A0A7R8WCE6_9CRUS|nr:unnamed protein product [Cyprideis torosa]CAG0893363.1 unnamed protein product [Cyprideis torosa]